MKILLTGATGFLGSNVLRILLQKGYNVRALRRANSRMDLVADIADRVEWLEMDITDIALEEAFEGITHVCHCAALSPALGREDTGLAGFLSFELENIILSEGKVI